jgi:hypothetical protein
LFPGADHAACSAVGRILRQVESFVDVFIAVVVATVTQFDGTGEGVVRRIVAVETSTIRADSKPIAVLVEAVAADAVIGCAHVAQLVAQVHFQTGSSGRARAAGRAIGRAVKAVQRLKALVAQASAVGVRFTRGAEKPIDGHAQLNGIATRVHEYDALVVRQ